MMDFCYPVSPTRFNQEMEKLVNRLYPPMVSIDNAYDNMTTLIKVDSANKRGSLLEVAQALNDLNLIIRKAYISSDGQWFMDVFYVTDECGNKVYDDEIAERVQQSLRPSVLKRYELEERCVAVEFASDHQHTTIELSGSDRPGLLSEVFAILTDLNCNIIGAEVWTHNSRMASVVYITDAEANKTPIDDPNRLSNIKNLLLHVLKGNNRVWRSANSSFSAGSTHVQRRLHQIMYADRDYDYRNSDVSITEKDKNKPLVTVEVCVEKQYSVVHVSCPDRPKLLFDTVCTMTDMKYVISHGTISADGPVAKQEYFIRHRDGRPIDSEVERERVIRCLEAAIKRRSFEGIRLELCSEDRVGLLSQVTRIFRENGMSVIRAEVKTRGTQAVNVFYVTDASGYPVKSETIEAVRKEIGFNVLCVKDGTYWTSPPKKTSRFSLASLFRSRSEKFFHSLGLMISRFPR